MSAESAVLAGRVAAESLMVDACIIDRPVGDSVLNTTTGQMEQAYAVLYDGLTPGAGAKCRVQNPGTQAANPNAGEHQFVILGLILQLPIDATVYKIGDRVRITAAALDPALVDTLAGREITVSSFVPKTHATKRLLVCDEVAA